jgi:hypothetical protein
MDRIGYFNQKSLQQDAKRIFELSNHIQDELSAMQVHDAWQVSVEMATAIYTARLSVEYPGFGDTEIPQ